MASRRVLCVDCGGEMNLSPHTAKQILPRSDIGEPAEFERIVTGFALVPQPSQRQIFVNEKAYPLEGGHFNCDRCNSKIFPGKKVFCVSIWNERQKEPGPWELAYAKEMP